MNNKKVFVLQGIGNIGKTTTIVKIIELFLNECEECSIIDRDFNNKRHNGEPVDRWIALNFKGKKIGITTFGDTKGLIKKHLDAIDRVAGECDIYVCAARSSGETCDYICGERFKGSEIICHQRWTVRIENEELFSFEELCNETQRMQAEYIKLQIEKACEH